MFRPIAFALVLVLAFAGCSKPGVGSDDEGKNDLPGDAVDPAKGQTTESGLTWYVIKPGDGPKPAATDTVRVHYTGWKITGEKFDSSVDRGEPAEFPLNRVIKGWTEGLQLMPVGSKYKLVIPAKMAYGENPGGGRPGGVLVFDVELLAIVGK